MKNFFLIISLSVVALLSACDCGNHEARYYVIPDAKKQEAAVLYQSIYAQSMAKGRGGFSKEDAEDAVNKIYGELVVVPAKKSK